jgi:hypothetical protein
MILPSTMVERGGIPGLERLGGLDVVVAIDEDGRPARGLERLGVDERVPSGLDQLDDREAHRPEILDEELRGESGVWVVVGLGGDAGDSQERLELLLELPLFGLEIRVHPIDRHAPPTLRFAVRPEGRPEGGRSGPLEGVQYTRRGGDRATGTLCSDRVGNSGLHSKKDRASC